MLELKGCEIKQIKEKKTELKFKEMDLDDDVLTILKMKGIDNLYSHQVDALNIINDNKNLVISSPTATGKSEIYMISIFKEALKSNTSLLIYPTKALARDQLNRLKEFNLFGLRCQVYDGDTTSHFRKKIKEDPPHVLITNMDMLHFILLKNKIWKKFFSKLKYVVLDEVHVYTGIFGSNCANILKRLYRICKENQIQTIATSATINNPKEFCKMLTQREFKSIILDDVKKTDINHYLIFPYGTSYISCAINLISKIKGSTLIFADSQQLVERIGLFTKNLEVYRGGLDYKTRKQLEKDFKIGKIEKLVCTSALELGIDIGKIQNIILVGWPKTITRKKQRIGRAGRQNQTANAYYIAKLNALDFYYFENENEYLNAKPESSFVNADNEKIVKKHMLSMIQDFPLNDSEIEDEKQKKIINELEKENYIIKKENKWIISYEGAILNKKLNIRNILDNITIINKDTMKTIATRDYYNGLFELYENAIYLIGAKRYVVIGLDLNEKKAYVKKLNDNSFDYTLPIRKKESNIIKVIKQKTINNRKLIFAKIHITEEIIGYGKYDGKTSKLIERKYLENPYCFDFKTYGLIYDLNDLVYSFDDFLNGLHAVEHITISMIPAITGADPREIGGISYSNGQFVIYDGIPDGNGVSDVVFDRFKEVLFMAKKSINKCDCENGCPRCILDSSCGNSNLHLNKQVGIDIFNEII